MYRYDSIPTRYVAIDTETTGLHRHMGHRPFAAAATFPDGREMFWRDEFTGLRELVEDPTLDKVFHNAKFDWGMLEELGYDVRGRVWDTGILIHLLDGRDAQGGGGLDYASRKYLPAQYRKVAAEIEGWFDSRKIPKTRRSFTTLPHDLLRRRCIGDTGLTLKLFQKLLPTVLRTFPYLLDQEHRLIPIVKRMQDRGITIDPIEVETQLKYFAGVVDDVGLFAQGVLDWPWWNINSREHQRKLLESAGLYEFLNEWTTPNKKRKSKKPFVATRKITTTTLTDLHHPVAHMLIVGKAAQKMISPFLSQAHELSVDNVLHCNYKQTGTVSGRFSCSEPNLQNIPVEGEHRAGWTEEEASEAFEMTGHNFAPHIKRIFLVRPGYVHIHMDKVQAEMYALGFYTKDKRLIELLQQGSVHDGMCKLMFGELTKGLKQRSKAVTFGYQYGAGLDTIALSCSPFGMVLI